MYRALGTQWATSVLAFLAIITISIPFASYLKYGPKIRRKWSMPKYYNLKGIRGFRIKAWLWDGSGIHIYLHNNSSPCFKRCEVCGWLSLSGRKFRDNKMINRIYTSVNPNLWTSFCLSNRGLLPGFRPAKMLPNTLSNDLLIHRLAPIAPWPAKSSPRCCNWRFSPSPTSSLRLQHRNTDCTQRDNSYVCRRPTAS